jgi:hypothetical protein
VRRMLPNTQVRSPHGVECHCESMLEQILAENGGENMCIFKVGITGQPEVRAVHYLESGFRQVFLIHNSHLPCVIEQLEVLLIGKFGHCVGCRNRNPGGEGRMRACPFPDGPFYLYVAASRADQRRPIAG